MDCLTAWPPCGPKKVIVVIGATGNQGGGVIRALCTNSRYEVRAFTRNTQSPKAKLLANMARVTVVKGDLDDEDSLIAAFHGAYGVFFVTNFWEHGQPDKEEKQARAVANAAKRCEVMHVVKSTLENTLDFGAAGTLPNIKIGDKAYKVPHFDGKGATDSYFTTLGVPTTLMRTSFYLENLIKFGMHPKSDGAGKFILTFPMREDTVLPVISSRDIGMCAAAIFKRPELIDQTVGIAGDKVTGPQIAAMIAEVRHVAVEYQSIPAQDYRSLGFPGAKDLGNMFQWQEEHNQEFCGRRDVVFSKKLYPDIMDLRNWMFIYGKDIPM